MLQLNRESRKESIRFGSGPAAVIPIPEDSGISIFAGSEPLFLFEWEGWQRSGEPEDLPDKDDGSVIHGCGVLRICLLADGRRG